MSGLVCPRDCPGRYPGCGANCERFKAHRAEREAVYQKRLTQARIAIVLDNGYRKTVKK